MQLRYAYYGTQTQLRGHQFLRKQADTCVPTKTYLGVV